jgi:hypothetical protein
VSKVPIVVGLLVGVALVLTLVFGRFRGADEPPARPPELPLVSAPAAPPPVAATPAARIEVPPIPTPDAHVLRVLVQDREKRPIAGAAIEVTGDDRALSFPLTAADGWTSAARMPSGDVHLLARADGASGTAQWRWTSHAPTEVTIWLNRDRDVEVAITDRANQPHIGTRIGLFGGKETDWRTTAVTAEAGNDGVARFHVEGRSWLAANATVRAVAMLGSARVTTEAIAWAETGPTRFALVVDAPATPPGPVLRVRFTDQGGVAAAAKGKLTWSRIMSAGTGTFEGHVGEVPVDGLEARVAPLRDGDHLRLLLWEDGRLAARLEVTLPTGVRDPEVVLPRGQVAPRLAIPVVDAAGKPVTTGAFVVTVLLSGGGYESESEVQPNGEGLLVVALGEPRGGKVEIAEPRDASRLFWPPPIRLERPYRTSIGKESPPNPPLAVLEFGKPEPGATIRLAPVTVPDVAPRLHGVVLTADGKPAAGVRIWLTTVNVPEPAAFADFATQTDTEGRFAIRATELPEEVFLGGRRPFGFCAPVRVRPSAEPVTLRLQPTGTIAMDLREPARPAMPEELARQLRARMDLRIDEDALADGNWMFFRQRRPVFESGYRDRWSVWAWVPDQGDCVLRDLVPGEYRVIGNVGNNRVLDVPGVRVVAGETARPAALQGVVVGAGVEANRVRVRDAEGRPLAKVRVRLMLAEWRPFLQHAEWRDTDASGEAWFVVPRGAVGEIELTAQGLAPVQLRDAALPAEVTMGAGTSLEFAISGLEAIRADARAVVVGCMAFDGAPPESPVQEVAKMQMFRHPQANLDGTGRATIQSLPPGNYRLWLGVVPPLRSARGHTFVLLGDRVIQARDPARVVVEHTVTAEQAATLLGR